MSKLKMDYAGGSIGKLFIKQLVPNILGMVFGALFIIVDGIFVGNGLGSDALAAINIVVPIFTVMTGIGLMFGMGAAIIATIHLSRGKRSSANVVITESFIISSLLMFLCSIIGVCFPDEIVILLGAPSGIVSQASEYLITFSCFSVFQMALSSLPFFVRISSPNYSLLCLSVATVLNIILDYLFIFVFKWGLFGAAFATGLGQAVGTIMLIGFLMRKSSPIRFVRPRINRRNIQFALGNTASICRLGFPVLLSEITISVMAVTGNYTFSRYIGVDGVAAFSVINYLFPVVFMVFNAVIQSAQPIVSYNYGLRQPARYIKAVRLALFSAIGISTVFVLVSTLFNQVIVSMFIPDLTNPAGILAAEGLPYFSLDFIFFGINVVAIGYYMSIGNVRRALIFTTIRGILPVICFLILPVWFGTVGIWLSVPVAEILSASVVAVVVFAKRKQRQC